MGNVTKANTKGYSVGSASLACFLLFSAYLDEVEMMTGTKFTVIDIAVPEIYIGGLLGSMSNKEQAVALCLLLGTTVIIMAHMRRSHRRRASIGVTLPGGVTVTINLSEPSQLANLPEEWKRVFRFSIQILLSLSCRSTRHVK